MALSCWRKKVILEMYGSNRRIDNCMIASGMKYMQQVKSILSNVIFISNRKSPLCEREVSDQREVIDA